MVRSSWKCLENTKDEVEGITRIIEKYVRYDYKSDKELSGKRKDILYVVGGVRVANISIYSRKSLGEIDHNVLFINSACLRKGGWEEVIDKIKKLHKSAQESEFMAGPVI